MILKLTLILTAGIALLGGLYFEVHQRNQGVLDNAKPQQVLTLRSAKTIRDYRQ